jgi:hypothetical protein
MEKYIDHPNRERIVAREMGWTWIEKMLDAEAELCEEEMPGDEECELAEMNQDPVRHPLVARLTERSVTLMKLAGNKWDNDLAEMVGCFMTIGPKIAGSLAIVRPGREIDSDLNGLVIARLKRATGELSCALNAASRLKEKNANLPFSIDEWISEMLEIRQEILSLMNEFRH